MGERSCKWRAARSSKPSPLQSPECVHANNGLPHTQTHRMMQAAGLGCAQDLCLVGGGSKNALWGQVLADAFQLPGMRMVGSLMRYGRARTVTCIHQMYCRCTVDVHIFIIDFICPQEPIGIFKHFEHYATSGSLTRRRRRPSEPHFKVLLWPRVSRWGRLWRSSTAAVGAAR